MIKGDKIILYFDCFGVVSEEESTVRSVSKEGITLENNYFDTETGKEYYLFSTGSGKCLNEPKSVFGGKRSLKINRI